MKLEPVFYLLRRWFQYSQRRLASLMNDRVRASQLLRGGGRCEICAERGVQKVAPIHTGESNTTRNSEVELIFL